VTLAGTQLCGLSECYSFGDDLQQAENYPMVRFVDSNGGVTYARAHDVSTRSIAPGAPGTVLVDIPAALAPGNYTVQVVAMGISPVQPTITSVVTSPTITSVDPSSGSTVGGTWILIQGSGLDNTTAVFFGGTPSPEIQILGPGEIGASAPAEKASPVSIVVQAIGGMSTPDSRSVFTYVYAPAVSSITVNSDILWAGTSTTGTITLNEPAPSGGTTVALSASGASGIALPASAFISTGGVSTTFPITTAPTAQAGTVTITATGPGGSAATTTEISQGQILLLVTSSTPASPPMSSMLASGQPVTLTIYVRTPAPQTGATLSLGTSVQNIALVPGNPPSLSLSGGATSTEVTMRPTVNVGFAGKLTITANYGGNSGTIILSVAKPLAHPPPVGPNPV
jgi:IPT/TIG domain